MKRIITLIAVFFIANSANSQLLTWTGDFLHETDVFWQITMDANYGNKGLLNYTPTNDVYVHIGVITNQSTSGSDWRHVQTTWASTAPIGLAPSAGTNKWAYTVAGKSIRSFFGLTDPTETILKIAIIFRNGAGTTKQGNADGSDMYVPVYDNTLHTRITSPFRQPTYLPLPETVSKKVGDALPIVAKASSSSTMTVYYNGTQIAQQASTTSISTSTTIAVAGNQQIIVTANNGSTTVADTFNFVVVAPNTIAALPNGVTDGINYEPGDTSVTMVLYAPNKQNVFIVGDFTNNYQQLAKYQMNRTPDSSRYWIRVTGLTPGVEYGYQYVIDGSLKVADYNCEKILDPYNDKYISPTTYPNLKPYPLAYTTGIVSILQTAKPQYNWQVKNFAKPDKRNLVIYELLVRDFLDSANYNNLKDTITYLKKLGINAIELMPFNEFDGNNSWGYNPSFYFAPDKAYGTELALKAFIDECHKNGIAVIQDLVMNHSWGSSPMVQMYFNSAAGTPAINSPWFNVTPTHDYNVGYQFDHTKQATQDFVDRVVNHWLTNYNIDGFRWDLSKGFTEKNTVGHIDIWAQYDQSRVDIWNRIYNKMKSISPNSYCILEHFADNSEETVLANAGMMPWGNLSSNYEQVTMGWPTNWDLSWGISASRGWNSPYLVTYAESHDQERLMYDNEQNGNSSGSYNVKSVPTGLQRNAAAAAILLMQPGPKMIWQFGELGYDTSLHRCYNATINPNSCNTDPKPPMWSYTANPDRKALHDVYAKLINFRTSPNYQSTFTAGVIANNYDLGSNAYVKQEKLWDLNLNMHVVTFANFDVNQRNGTAISFPSNGTWYYYVGSTNNYNTINVSNYTYSFNLQPGEYYVFTSAPVVLTSNITIGGNLVTPNGKPIKGATVLLNGSGTQFNTNYSFTVSSNSSNLISVTKNNDGQKTNGVTALDISYIQNHILGKSLLNSPYKIIAADVNGDGKVSALDIAYIKRFILKMDTTFINVKTGAKRLWTFVDSNYVFPTKLPNPFSIKDSNSYTGLTTNSTNQTFIGCKLGDVDWSWDATKPKLASINQLNSVVLSYDPININTGNEIRIPVRINNFKEMLGMQFTISFNSDVMKWEGINNNVLNIETGTNHASEGNITFLWVDPNNEIKTIEDGSVIMELVFTKKANCINEQLDLNGTITSVQAFDKNYQLHNVMINPSNISSVEIKDNWVVSPNPATNGVIKSQIQLKENKTILFRLIDINGKVIMEQKQECLRGNNFVPLRENNIVPAGTYYLQALGVEGVTVKKILVR